MSNLFTSLGSRWVCVCCIESLQDSAENCGPFLVKRARAHHHTILFYLCVVLGPSNKSTSHTLGNTEPSLPSALSTRRNWKMENLSLGNDAFHSIGPHALLYQAYSQSIKVPQTNLMINCRSDQSKYQCTIMPWWPRSHNHLQATYTLGTCQTSMMMMCCQKCTSQIFVRSW